MRKRAQIAVLVACAAIASGQALAERELLSAPEANYPPLARQARIQGDVVIQYHVDEQGVPSDIEVVSGHPMLIQAALENLGAWHFKVASKHDASTYTTSFRFELADVSEEYDYGPKNVRHGSEFVEVIESGNGQPRARECPNKNTPVPESSSNDFLLFEALDYNIRLAANGDVQWSNAEGQHAFKVPVRRAQDLFQSFNTHQIWNLCGRYERYNGQGTRLTLNIGTAQKSIEDVGRASPGVLLELEHRLDILTRTHDWRHGDPVSEPIWNIQDERAKPNLPPLLAAARDCDAEKVKNLIAAGESLSTADASGWTPLMYAALCWDDTERRLLKAGADPNQTSYRGDTALMVRALGGYLDEDLLRAGANINAQDTDGRTALMFLATRNGEIQYALEAGANPTLKDSRGLTALDYWRIANCRGNPMLEGLEAIPSAPIRSEHSDEAEESNEDSSCDLFPAESATEIIQQLNAPYNPLHKPHIPHILRPSY